jgi:antitoxin ParD1/3/4
MPTRNINLTEHFDRFIQAELKSGRYSNASEVVREGLRLMERLKRQEQAKLNWLRGAVKDALDELDRAKGREFCSIEDVDAYIDRLAKDRSEEVPRPKKRA